MTACELLSLHCTLILAARFCRMIWDFLSHSHSQLLMLSVLDITSSVACFCAGVAFMICFLLCYISQSTCQCQQLHSITHDLWPFILIWNQSLLELSFHSPSAISLRLLFISDSLDTVEDQLRRHPSDHLGHLKQVRMRHLRDKRHTFISLKSYCLHSFNNIFPILSVLLV